MQQICLLSDLRDGDVSQKEAMLRLHRLPAPDPSVCSTNRPSRVA